MLDLLLKRSHKSRQQHLVSVSRTRMMNYITWWLEDLLLSSLTHFSLCPLKGRGRRGEKRLHPKICVQHTVLLSLIIGFKKTHLACTHTKKRKLPSFLKKRSFFNKNPCFSVSSLKADSSIIKEAEHEQYIWRKKHFTMKISLQDCWIKERNSWLY